MLAVKIGHRNELVQNTRLFRPVTPGISRRNRFNQFIPCRHAHPPHLCSRGCQPLGNISDEAMTDPWGAVLARQCGFSSRLSRYTNHPPDGKLARNLTEPVGTSPPTPGD